MFHYLITTVKLYRTFRLDSYKNTTLKQRVNIAKAVYGKKDGRRHGWADLLVGPRALQEPKKEKG